MEKLTHYMSIIKKNCIQFLNDNLRPLNITSGEMPFIQFLNDHKECRQSDLSKSFDCNKAHTHRVITKLIDKNIVQYSTVNPQLISLTAKGKSLCKKINVAHQNWLTSLSNGISQQEIETAFNVIKKCAENSNKLKSENIDD